MIEVAHYLLGYVPGRDEVVYSILEGYHSYFLLALFVGFRASHGA